MVWSVAISPDGRLIASGSDDRTLRRGIASPEDSFRLTRARLAHHPLLRDPASVSTDPEVVAAGKRTQQGLQARWPPCRKVQPQGPAEALQALQAWARWP